MMNGYNGLIERSGHQTTASRTFDSLLRGCSRTLGPYIQGWTPRDLMSAAQADPDNPLCRETHAHAAQKTSSREQQSSARARKSQTAECIQC